MGRIIKEDLFAFYRKKRAFYFYYPVYPAHLVRFIIWREFIPNVIQKLVFDGVGFASKFLSSLVPWPLAMVPRSRRKILSSLLVKIPTFEPPSV